MCLIFVGQGYTHENYLTLNISQFTVIRSFASTYPQYVSGLTKTNYVS